MLFSLKLYLQTWDILGSIERNHNQNQNDDRFGLDDKPHEIQTYRAALTTFLLFLSPFHDFQLSFDIEQQLARFC